jgi:alpha-tubulin suppressor-like RCC1 family protein/UDP-3-O-[3-hydroxymyristoyl] glucosamine N-acyltransferase
MSALSLLVTIALAADVDNNGCEDTIPQACVHPSTTVAPGATIGAGAHVGPGLTIGAAVIGPRAQLVGRDDAVGVLHVGDGASIGRRAVIGADADLLDFDVAADVVIGPRLKAEDGTLVGFGSTLGADVTLQTGALVGNLATIGDGATISGEVGRSSIVEAGATVHGSVGPDVEVGAGALVEAGSRVMRGASVGAGAEIGAGARVGRGVDVGNYAIVDGASLRAGSTVPACTDVPSGEVVGRGETWGGPTRSGCVANPITPTWTLGARANTMCAAVAGQARCWGTNAEKQTGDPSNSPTHTPYAQPSLSGVDHAIGGIHFSCARIGGTARCWGSAASGALGSTSPVSSGTTFNPNNAVTGLTTIVQLSVGDSHACARLADGTVRCWGDDGLGSVGNGAGGGGATPATVTGVTGAVDLFASDHHACAVQGNGQVKCWGRNNNGQLGKGSASPSCGGGGDNCETSPVTVTGISDATRVFVGHNAVCALRSGGAVSCWGANANGQLLTGATSGNQFSPVSASQAPANLEQIALGLDHGCALTRGGDVYCWGSRANGKVGDGSTSGNALTPYHVTLPAQATEVAVGWGQSCARLTTGSVLCWGADAAGQIGNGNDGTGNKLVPTAVTGVP